MRGRDYIESYCEKAELAYENAVANPDHPIAFTFLYLYGTEIDKPNIYAMMGASYKSIAHIAHLIGFTDGKRKLLYRWFENLELTQLHAMHIIKVIKSYRKEVEELTKITYEEHHK